MTTARKETWRWMIDNASKMKSSLELAIAASEEFSNVIGLDTFLWNDAQLIWEYKNTNTKGKKYAFV